MSACGTWDYRFPSYKVFLRDPNRIYRVSEKSTENSEQLVRQARPGQHPKSSSFERYHSVTGGSKWRMVNERSVMVSMSKFAVKSISVCGGGVALGKVMDSFCEIQ